MFHTYIEYLFVDMKDRRCMNLRTSMTQALNDAEIATVVGSNKSKRKAIAKAFFRGISVSFESCNETIVNFTTDCIPIFDNEPRCNSSRVNFGVR